MLCENFGERHHRSIPDLRITKKSRPNHNLVNYDMTVRFVYDSYPSNPVNNYLKLRLHEVIRYLGTRSIETDTIIGCHKFHVQ